MAWFYPIAPDYVPYLGAFCFGFSDSIEQTQLFSLLSTLFPNRIAAAMGFKLFIQSGTTGLMFFIHSAVTFEAQSVLMLVFAALGVVSLVALQIMLNDLILVRLGSVDDFSLLSAREETEGEEEEEEEE